MIKKILIEADTDPIECHPQNGRKGAGSHRYRPLQMRQRKSIKRQIERYVTVERALMIVAIHQDNGIQ